MYHEADPLHGSVVPGSLPNPRAAFKGYKPISITQRQPQEETLPAILLGSLLASSSSSSSSSSAAAASVTAQKSTLLSSSSANGKDSAKKLLSPSTPTYNSNNNKLHTFELLNEDVKLPAMETLFWCKVFEFQEFSQKQHLVKVSF